MTTIKKNANEVTKKKKNWCVTNNLKPNINSNGIFFLWARIGIIVGGKGEINNIYYNASKESKKKKRLTHFNYN
jgi:hypothetical protein